MQTKVHSVLEGTANIILGSGVGYAANVYVGLSAHTSLVLTVVLTIISFIRGYIVRRIFNWWSDR
jgi:hypothetical protein